MAIRGCNLNEVRQFNKEVNKLKRKIKNDEDYRNELLYQKANYEAIKEFFIEFLGFLRYAHDIKSDGYYRVRKVEENKPYTTRKDLIYPEPNIEHQDRMSNTSFRVLYTSFHEFTAMSEARIDKDYIGQKFQLTKFSSKKQLKTYKLGLFSELYLNSPRDYDSVKEQVIRLFGSECPDKLIQGYSALECAIANVLYSQDDNHHLLSSILSDAIFTNFQRIGKDIDAIAYPSLQNRYGMNFAIKKETADNLYITYSCLNKVKEVYQDGFFCLSNRS